MVRALRNHPALSAASLGVEAASREAEAARGNYLPTVALEERFSRTSAPAEVFGLKMNQQALSAADFADIDRFNDPAPRSGFTGSLSLQQPVFAPKAYLGMRMAGREAGAAAKDLDRRREEVLHSVLSAWLDVVTAKDLVAVAHRGRTDAVEHLRIAAATEGAGTGLPSDVLRAKVALARAESGLVTASTRLDLARRALGLAVGEGGGPGLDAEGAPPAFPPAGTMEERAAAAKASRADLAALSDRVANAGTAVDLERSGYLPTLGLQAAYQLDHESSPLSTDHGSWKAGVALSWTIFDGFRREASVARAKAEEGRAKEYRRGAGDGAAFEVSRAWLGLKDAESRLSIASASLASAEEGTRLVKSRYENQLARMVDLLDAQSALDDARLSCTRAENDVRHARAALELASGTLLSWAAEEGVVRGGPPGTPRPGAPPAPGSPPPGGGR
jgi:outer membrane protein TolC